MKELIERLRKQFVEMRLNVVRKSEVNPMDHVCEVSADEYQRFLHDAVEAADALEKMSAALRRIAAYDLKGPSPVTIAKEALAASK